MKVQELSSKIDKFRSELDKHGERLESKQLEWSTFYNSHIREIEAFNSRCESLIRQLATLRPYLEKLELSMMIDNGYAEWDAFESAVFPLTSTSSDNPLCRKLPSVRAALPKLQQALGKLDAMEPDSDFGLQSEGPQAVPQPVTTVYMYGDQSRVNVQSQDNSVNVSSSEQQVFTSIREARSSGVADKAERATILDKPDNLERSIHSKDSKWSCQAFINVFATLMTIIQSFIQLLFQFVFKK